MIEMMGPAVTGRTAGYLVPTYGINIPNLGGSEVIDTR
jgi:hypothetical protein